MEGLIPLVYRTVKRSRTRRQYKSVPSSVELQSYNISDFYPEGYNYRYTMTVPQLPEKRDQAFGFGGGGGGASTVEGGRPHHHHRRHMSSVGDYNSSGFSGAATPENLVKPKQLVRFRSHRFFSCVTGTP